MAKIKLVVSATIEETFSDFIISRKTKGLAEKTLQSYQSQFQAVAKHMDVKMDIAMLQKADLDAMIISMRDASLSPNSINSYTRTLKSFFSWCNEQGITRLNIPLYKAEETVKETYSDAELAALLKKPDIRKATFAEYRDWVIINFLLNCGSRAATVRAIQIRDVDLDGGMVFYRHISGILDFELSGYGNRDFDIAWSLILRPGQRFLKTEKEKSIFLSGYAKHGQYNISNIHYYMAQIYVYFLSFCGDDAEYCNYIRAWLLENCNCQ